MGTGLRRYDRWLGYTRLMLSTSSNLDPWIPAFAGNDG
jgi:hypothetical protein